MNTAAAALGLHTSNLNLQIQRLETDVGAPLVHRANHHRPITLTDRGHRLLEHLDHPEVRRLLHRHASPSLARPTRKDP